MTEAIPAVIEGCAVGVLALLSQPGFVVVPGGALAQGVGVGKQAAFGVAFEVFFGLVGVDQSYELSGEVFVAGDMTFGVGDMTEPRGGIFLLKSGELISGARNRGSRWRSRWRRRWSSYHLKPRECR